LVALADQLAGHRVGYLNHALYGPSHSSHEYAALFHDVTTGDNTFHGPVTIAGFAATTGWDPATGLGTPRAGRLVSQLGST
jgi:hypothetical protein